MWSLSLTSMDSGIRTMVTQSLQSFDKLSSYNSAKTIWFHIKDKTSSLPFLNCENSFDLLIKFAQGFN